MKTAIKIFFFIPLLFPFILIGQICVEFESLNLGDQFGNGINSIGDEILVENNIRVSVEYFEYETSGGTFGLATVSDGSSGINSSHDVFLSNINFKFDFSYFDEVPNYITFDFVDQGGHENLAVNGGTIYAGELANAALPSGVILFISGMGSYYRATLLGDISSLTVGGQEFSIDNICIDNVDVSTYCVDFETLSLGTNYGNGYNAIGDVIFTEDEIPVSVEYFDWVGGGGTFGTCTVSNSSGIGSGQDMMTNNINLGFDFTALPDVPQLVTFDFADYGGFENMAVNGGTIYKGEIVSATVPAGISYTCLTVGNIGHGTLEGEISHLLFGGQEFFMDNICAYIFSQQQGVEDHDFERNVSIYSYPNPFSNQTSISFEIPEPSYVTIIIFDLMGKEVNMIANDKFLSGQYAVVWNGENYSGNRVEEGIYIYQVRLNRKIYTGKLSIVE